MERPSTIGSSIDIFQFQLKDAANNNTSPGCIFTFYLCTLIRATFLCRRTPAIEIFLEFCYYCWVTNNPLQGIVYLHIRGMSSAFSSHMKILFKFVESEVLMDIVMESVGDRIKNRRKEIQLTQTDIFEMCGIRSGSLSRIENGTSVPSVILFYRIAQVLKCDMEWLLTGVSSNMKIPAFSKNEEKLIDGFRKLSEEDQEELLGILELKLRKGKSVTTKDVRSSELTDPEKDNMAG